MAKAAQVGDDAPDFELEGTDGTFRLSEQRGRRVVLLFYPGDNTPVCTKQFCSYRDNADAMGGLDALVVGISGKDVGSKEEFAANNELTVPLLADEDGAVSKAYANFRMGGTKRSVVIVDEQGKVAYRHDHTLGLDFQTAAELKDALESLPAAAG
jgi:thioredoxin-dependent peroxiredoxin